MQIRFSPAKINLFLHILARREDGMHLLRSVFAKLDFGDVLSFENKKEGIELLASGKYKIPTNAENLVYQSAALLRQKAKGKRGVRIHIQKNIPLGAGLGGGSSNAATTLLFLNKHWEINLPLQELQKMGATLGADIPFFLQETASLAEVSGIGESISPIQKFDLLDLKEKIIVLCVPKNISVSTPWAYAELVKYFQGKYPQNPATLSNTFEEAIFQVFPDLLSIKNIFLQMGAEHALMTGSGSVVFGIFSQKIDLETLKKSLTMKGELIFSKLL